MTGPKKKVAPPRKVNNRRRPSAWRHDLGGDDLGVERPQPARDAGKETEIMKAR